MGKQGVLIRVSNPVSIGGCNVFTVTFLFYLVAKSLDLSKHLNSGYELRASQDLCTNSCSYNNGMESEIVGSRLLGVCKKMLSCPADLTTW